MNEPIRVIIHTDGGGVYLQRSQSNTDGRREIIFHLDVVEIDNLIQSLKSVKSEMAKRKRLAANELLQQAERLDPIVRPGDV
jgi:hypothetical protein